MPIFLTPSSHAANVPPFGALFFPATTTNVLAATTRTLSTATTSATFDDVPPNQRSAPMNTSHGAPFITWVRSIPVAP